MQRSSEDIEVLYFHNTSSFSDMHSENLLHHMLSFWSIFPGQQSKLYKNLQLC